MDKELIGNKYVLSLVHKILELEEKLNSFQTTYKDEKISERVMEFLK